MKNVTLLVCLSPSVASHLITEASFFGIVNPLTPVSNVKMVSTEGQLKAFVQVKDEEAASSVIDALHGRTLQLGKLKVYVSNKKFINYEKRLSDILGFASLSHNGSNSFETQKKGAENGDSASTSCNMRRGSTLGTEGTKARNSIFCRNSGLFAKSSEFVIKERLEAKINGGGKILKFSKTDTCMLEANLTNSKISITHDNPLELKSRKISEVFGVFGNIIKKNYDSANLIWTITFDNEESAASAAANIKDTKLGDYNLVEQLDAKTPHPNISRIHNMRSAETQVPSRYATLPTEASVTLQDGRSNASPDKHAPLALRITDISQRASASAICRLVSRVAMPIEVLEACDVRAQQFFYIVKFSNNDIAADVHKFMSDCADLMPHMHVAFE